MEEENSFADFDNNEEVKLVIYCPFCESDLNPVKAKLIDNKEDLYLVHIQCKKCQGNILAVLMKTAAGINSLGLITDLNSADAFRFKDKERLLADEVLEMVENFKQKNISQVILEN